MTDEQQVNLHVDDDIEEPKYSNTFRVLATDTELFIDFARFNPEHSELTVTSKIILPIDFLPILVSDLEQIRKDYEDRTGNKLEFDPSEIKRVTVETELDEDDD